MASLTWPSEHLGSAYKVVIFVMGIFVVFSFQNAKEDLITFYGVVSSRVQLGTISFRNLVLSMLINDLIREFLLDPSLFGKGCFLWLARVCYVRRLRVNWVIR